MSVTVASIITRALSIADCVNSSYITTRDQIDAVNDSYRDAYNTLLNNNDDYFVTTVTPTAQIATYTMPDDVMRVRAVDFKASDGRYWEMKKFSMNQRNEMQLGISQWNPMYRLKGQTIYIIPQDQSYDLRVWYYPTSTTLMSTAVVAWVTSTAYNIGDMVSNGGSYYSCSIAHTSGTFATDLAAGKWTLYASTVSTSISYPNNLVFEILYYSAAKEFRRKARQDYAPIDQRLAELWARFDSQQQRDNANNDKINNVYARRAWL